MESLDIDLHDEKEVELVLKTFPNLKYLNGHPVNPEDFIDESSREAVTPENQDASKSIESIQQIKEEENEDEPIETPAINTSNSQQPKRNSMTPSNQSNPSSGSQEFSDSEEINLKPRDLESIALIFDKIRNLHRKNKLSNDKEMAAEFDTHLKS